MVLRQVQYIRQLHPVMGGRKLYCMLQPFLRDHQIKIGRDALFDLLAIHKLLVRKRLRRTSTTQSHHWLKKYPNLIREWQPAQPGQLWVADITYVASGQGFLYLSLITDAYSHKIIGYSVANNLAAVNTLTALKMALRNNPPAKSLVHHSDRGIQYCSTEYINLLKEHHIRVSMTESGDPLENALAERVNGIIKNEYLQHYTFKCADDLLKLLVSVVYRYNCERPHFSINMLTPDSVHRLSLPVNRKWSKNYQMPNIVNL